MLGFEPLGGRALGGTDPTFVGSAAGVSSASGGLRAQKSMTGAAAGVGSASSSSAAIPHVGVSAGTSTASAGLKAEKHMTGSAAGRTTVAGRLRRRRGRVRGNFKAMAGFSAGSGTARSGGRGIAIMAGFAAGRGTASSESPRPPALMSGLAAGIGTARAGTRGFVVMSGLAAGAGTAIARMSTPVLLVEDDAVVIRSRLISGSIDRNNRERTPTLDAPVASPGSATNNVRTSIYFDVGLQQEHPPDLRAAVNLQLIFTKPSGAQVIVVPSVETEDAVVNNRELYASEYVRHIFGVGELDEAGEWSVYMSYDEPQLLRYWISPLEHFTVDQINV